MGCIKWTVITVIILPLSAVILQWINSVDVENYYKNKRIIVTGASQGIGKDLAIRLAQLGSRLVITARTESKLKETQKLCQQYSQDVFVVKADVGNEEDTKLIVNETVKRLGGIDILILNAAHMPPPRVFTEYDNPGQLFLDVYKLLDELVVFYKRVNVLQGVYLTQYSLDYLRESHGIILAVSSMAGWLSTASFSPYTASKHALHGYFGTLNMELRMRNENISVTIMPLPFIFTDHAISNLKLQQPRQWMGVTSEDCAERMIKGLPLKKLYYYITWEAYFVARFYSLCPICFDYITLTFMQMVTDAIK